MIIFYNAQDSMASRILEAVLKLKQIEYTTEQVVSECAISDRDLLVDDLKIAIQFLDEKFPSPKLFPGKPEQVARLSLFTDKVCEALNTGYFQELLSEVNDFVPPELFITGDTITIADILLNELLLNKPQWANYKKRVSNHNLQKV